MSAVRLAARAVVVSALGFTLVPVLGANPAYACSCIQSTEQENYERADVVFKGVVEDVETSKEGFGSQRFVFTPSQTYKGKTSVPQEVTSAGNSAACGVNLDGAGPFLVFANATEDGLSTSLCSGTREIGPEESPEFKAHGDGSDGKAYKGDSASGGAGPTEPAPDSNRGSDAPEPTSPDPDEKPIRLDDGPSRPDADPGNGPIVTTATDVPLMQTTGIAQDSATNESANAAAQDGPNAALVAAAGLLGLGAMAAVGIGLLRRKQSGA